MSKHERWNCISTDGNPTDDDCGYFQVYAPGSLQTHFIVWWNPDLTFNGAETNWEGFARWRSITHWRRLNDPTAPVADGVSARIECHGLDTPERICFYEQDFYVLSNFSAFRLNWGPFTFDTSEHAYHWEKFRGTSGIIQEKILVAKSAHEAFKLAEHHKIYRRPEWDSVKVGLMRRILRAKADQHEYVRRKLLQTGGRELVENSWRDDFWGWGPNQDGQNMLGKLWMEIREELRCVR